MRERVAAKAIYATEELKDLNETMFQSCSSQVAK